MTQKINIGELGASGIVGVLFIMGVFLIFTNIESNLGYISVFAAIVIAIIYGLLGAGGIMKRQHW